MSDALMSREERIFAHGRLCRAIAARFVRPGLERADLEQVAAIGLIKASDRYDCTLGTPFSAFARQRIVGELMHYVRDHESLIRLPRSLYELHRREIKAQVLFQSRCGYSASASEIAIELDVSLGEIHDLYEARHRCNIADIDALHDRSLQSSSLEQRAIVLHSLHSLGHDEQALVLGVYGLRLTQTDVGRRLGHSQRSASRLHKRALQKLSLVLKDAT